MKVKVGDCKKGLQPLGVFFLLAKVFPVHKYPACSKELVNNEGLIPGHSLRFAGLCAL